MKILDARGRELRVGDRVRWSQRHETTTVTADYTIVRFLLPANTGGTALSVGLYHGKREDYRSYFCIPWTRAEPTAPDTYRCPDLERIDSEGAK